MKLLLFVFLFIKTKGREIMYKFKQFSAKLLIFVMLSFVAAPAASNLLWEPISVQAASYSSATIKKVQQELNAAGYNCGTPDGVSGKKTVAAIKKYQKAQGLKQSGSINSTLLKSLGIEAEKSTSSSSSSSSSASSSNSDKSYTVYITDTGEKYHRSGCRYLKKSKIAINLSDVKSSYSPCSVCKP